MENLSLEIFNREGNGSKYAILPDDASISITDTSEIFGSGDIWSHSFTLNVHLNAHIFGTSGELHGSRLHEQIDKRKARLWVMGLPLYMGYLHLADETDVSKNGDVDVTFESGRKTFEQMIDGGKANQVPLLNDVLIGMALWRERDVEVSVKAYLGFVVNANNTGTAKLPIWYPYPDSSGSTATTITFSNHTTKKATRYPRMVFPKGEFATYASGAAGAKVTVNQLNTDSPYDDSHPYCNINLCYQKHGYPTVDGVTDYGSEEQELREYDTAPANRVNSAPCFYVLYWLRCLMKYLGIRINENQMMGIEDMRRLFLVNTNCAYEEPKDFDRTGEDIDERYGSFTTYTDGAGNAKDYIAELLESTVDKEESANIPLEVTEWEVKDGNNFRPVPSGDPLDVQKAWIWIMKQKTLTDEEKQEYIANNRFYHYAYATSDCFPDVDISEIISALENGFGIRFLFDNNYQNVRVVLLRNLFRDQDTQNIKGDILSAEKSESNVRGFRMTYGKGDEDTAFYYKGFADKLSSEKTLWADKSDTHDYSHWNLDASYQNLIKNISAFDKTCYVTKNNGNAYGIKVDKDAKRYKDLHPSLFGFADYMDAEDGICSGEEESVHEVNVGFTPAIMNDVNFDEERSTESTNQKFALFVDAEMRSRRPDLEDLEPPSSYNDSDAVYDVNKIENKQKKLGLFAINSDLITDSGIELEGTLRAQSVLYPRDGWVHFYVFKFQARSLESYINEGIRLYLQDNYEPNDDGVSPLETHDWGLTLGIMRGSGSDAYVNYMGDPDDNEGNSAWDIAPGSNVTAHPDTCDNYGRTWDYDGSVGYNQVCATAEDALGAMQAIFPNTNFDLAGRSSTTYLTGFFLPVVIDDEGVSHTLLMAGATKDGAIMMTDAMRQQYVNSLQGKSIADMIAWDKYEGRSLFIEADSSRERAYTLLRLQELAYANGAPVTISDGTDVREGRFSLKLRAEKPNPYYDPKSTDPNKKKKYLDITNPNLQNRGLCDQFYKEFSYWIRNARIANLEVEMELAQLLAIDKTKRVTVGDITGFIRKMEYNISKENGLGVVSMEIMYI